MEQSILKSVKIALGVGEDDHTFDQEIMMHINSSFTVLEQYGLKSDTAIEDDELTWEEYLPKGYKVSLVKSFVYAYVRSLFDPPPTSFAVQALKTQLDEMGWRIMEHVDYNEKNGYVKWIKNH